MRLQIRWTNLMYWSRITFLFLLYTLLLIHSTFHAWLFRSHDTLGSAWRSFNICLWNPEGMLLQWHDSWPTLLGRRRLAAPFAAQNSHWNLIKYIEAILEHSSRSPPFGHRCVMESGVMATTFLESQQTVIAADLRKRSSNVANSDFLPSTWQWADGCWGTYTSLCWLTQWKLLWQLSMSFI